MRAAPAPLPAMDAIERRICELAKQPVRFDLHHAIAPAAELEADLRMDDIDRVTLACLVDEHFAISFPDVELERWTTIADIACCVRHHLGIAV